MREIKFRIWDKEINKFTDALYLDPVDGSLYVSINYELESVDKNNYILCQYTGVKDKNKKEVYEGDIIKQEFEKEIKPKIFIVEYMVLENCGDCTNDSGVGFNFYLSNEINFKNNFLFDQIEVVGNIFENPELLDTKNANHE